MPSCAPSSSSSDSGVAYTTTDEGTPSRNCKVVPLPVESRVVCDVARRRSAPVLKVCEPVTYDIEPEKLYWCVAFCPTVPVRFRHTVLVRSSRMAFSSRGTPGCGVKTQLLFANVTPASSSSRDVTGLLHFPLCM